MFRVRLLCGQTFGFSPYPCVRPNVGVHDEIVQDGCPRIVLRQVVVKLGGNFFHLQQIMLSRGKGGNVSITNHKKENLGDREMMGETLSREREVETDGELYQKWERNAGGKCVEHKSERGKPWWSWDDGGNYRVVREMEMDREWHQKWEHNGGGKCVEHKSERGKPWWP